MLQDNEPMPYGKFKGKAMINVPAGYLLWLYENKRCSDSVKAYVEANMEALKKEKKKLTPRQLT
jgi:uncharacterized protein (DUF3820 family)